MTDPVHPMYATKYAEKGTIVRVGVAVVVRASDGGILLERRSDCGLWGLPGGRVEAGESVIQTALREVLEETGLTIRITKLQGVYSEPNGRIVTYFPEGTVAQLLDVVLEAEVTGGTLQCSAESLELKFFDAASLPNNLVPPAKAILADANNRMSGVIR